jgi:Fic family protein
MDWKNFRLSTRLSLEVPVVEQAYELITAIDSVRNSWQITKKLLPQTIEKLIHSVIVTSSGASNRIEGNRLTDKEVETLYRNLRIKKFKNRDEQEIAGYLEMLKWIFHDYTDIPSIRSANGVNLRKRLCVKFLSKIFTIKLSKELKKKRCCFYEKV